MGLLDKLWDDTVAGPRPDTGLGRLRKFPPFSIRTDFSKDGPAEGENGMRMSGENSPAAAEATTPRVTRSIMIRRPDGSPRGTPPESPAGSTPPVSPFLGSPGGRDWNKRFRRKSMSDAYERSRGNGGSSSTTTPTTPGESAASAAENGGNMDLLPSITLRSRCDDEI